MTWVPDVTKAYHALAFLADQADGVAIRTITVAAMLFDADVASVNKLGRPIYGEHWTVDWMGVRPTVAAGLLNGDAFAIEALDARYSTFHRGRPDPVWMATIRKSEVARLSASDREFLTDAYGRYRDHTARDVMLAMKTHPAVERAQGGVVTSRDMLGDGVDQDRIVEMDLDMLTTVF